MRGKSVALAVALGLLAGCGGGGSSNTRSSAGATTSTATPAPATVTTTTATTTSGAYGGVHLQTIGEFDYPLYVAVAPGEENLLFVVEKAGRIQVVQNGQEQAQPFLDIENLIDSSNGEQGLLSVAFDPGYAQNRRFYVAYTNKHRNDEVDEFRRSKDSPLRAAPGSRRVVLIVSHHQRRHDYGGQLQFHGGHLYVSIGNSGVPGDPTGTAQSKNTLLGKLLRIDPKPGGGYSVPRSNPFVGKPGRDEIFALGLRNPWRFSFDRKTGDLWLADVGYLTWEEIDHATLAQAKGANFGWNLFEGPKPCSGCGHKHASPPPHYIAPVHWYEHGGKGEYGNVIIGGYVVRDPDLPSLDGRYIYTDNVVGDLRAFDPRTRKWSELGLTVSQPTSFGEGFGGRIYVATLASPGPVYELLPGS